MANMVPFDWADPFNLDDQLTEEERMIRDAAHAFAQATLQPRVIEAFAQENDATELFPLMGEAGMLGVTIPEEFGGAGASYVAYGLVAREIERVDSGYRSMASVQSSLVMYPIHAYGSDEQRQQISPRPRLRRTDRLLRPDRTRCRVRPGGHAHLREEGRRRLFALRREDLDFQFALRRCVRGLGQVRSAWRQDPRLRARKGHGRAGGAQDRRQAFPARQHHRHDRDGRGEAARRRAAARCRRAQGAVRLPQPRALRHFLGQHGCGRILLSRRAPIRPRPPAVRRAAGVERSSTRKSWPTW